MLDNQEVGTACPNDLEPAGIGRMRQTSLPLDQDDPGRKVLKGTADGMLQFPGDKVVYRGIEQHGMRNALEPCGLAGTHHGGGNAVKQQFFA